MTEPHSNLWVFYAVFLFVYLGIMIPGKSVNPNRIAVSEMVQTNDKMLEIAQKELKEFVKSQSSSIKYISDPEDYGISRIKLLENAASLETNGTEFSERPVDARTAETSHPEQADSNDPHNAKLYELQERVFLHQKRRADLIVRTTQVRTYKFPFVNFELDKKQIVFLFTPISLGFFLVVLLGRLHGIVTVSPIMADSIHWTNFPAPFISTSGRLAFILKTIGATTLTVLTIYLSVDTYFWDENASVRSSESTTIVLALTFFCFVAFFTHIFSAFYRSRPHSGP